jgi:sugar/nucleoside kinase (ribokinase family)
VDEAGAQDAFVAGMIYALSRRMMPGPPYTPGGDGGVGGDVPNPRDPRPGTGHSTSSALSDEFRGRWKLEECLRLVFFKFLLFGFLFT